MTKQVVSSSWPYRFLVAVVFLPGGALAEEMKTVGDIFDQGTSLIKTASNLLVILAGLVGIALVAWSIFKLATEDDDRQRWRFVAAGAVGSLFTIFGVIVGAFSGLFT